MPTLLAGSLHEVSRPDGKILSQGVARTNPQSFIEQIRNLLAAMHNDEPLRVSGEEGIRSLRLIEQCYNHRTLMSMPWLTPREEEKAQRLARGVYTK